jgi:hypothetical protein
MFHSEYANQYMLTLTHLLLLSQLISSTPSSTLGILCSTQTIDIPVWLTASAVKHFVIMVGITLDALYTFVKTGYGQVN